MTYAIMDTLSSVTALDEDENYGADHRDEVERQVHKVPNQGLRAEALKGRLDNFPELGDGVGTWLELPAFLHDIGGALCHQGTIKGVEQCLLQQEVA